MTGPAAWACCDPGAFIQCGLEQAVASLNRFGISKSALF